MPHHLFRYMYPELQLNQSNFRKQKSIKTCISDTEIIKHSFIRPRKWLKICSKIIPRYCYHPSRKECSFLNKSFLPVAKQRQCWKTSLPWKISQSNPGGWWHNILQAGVVLFHLAANLKKMRFESPFKSFSDRIMLFVSLFCHSSSK